MRFYVPDENKRLLLNVSTVTLDRLQLKCANIVDVHDAKYVRLLSPCNFYQGVQMKDELLLHILDAMRFNECVFVW